jgi:carboxyl-terminal processing protease
MKVRSVLKVVLLLIVLVDCTAFGFFWRDVSHRQPLSTSALQRLFGAQNLSANLSSDQLFSKNYQRILADYERPLKPLDVKYAGIEGMVASLGDPHTIFLPPVQAQEFRDETNANFGGVGARLTGDPLGARVFNVFPDGPAFASGLRKGNIITGVDGLSVVGVDIDAIVDKIKGKEGTIVKLSVIQSGHQKPVVITIKRARIIAPTVDGQLLPGTHIGYMTISQFSEPTTEQFDRQIHILEDQHIKGLVIDVRGNPGGLLETASDMLSRFVSDKVVVTMRFRNGNEDTQKTNGGELHQFDYPIVVLIDQDSASAAEIFSGCLHDYGKVTLVGTHSYGKASVQNVFPLVDHSSAKITIARYYLPNGEYIGREVDQDGVMVKGGLEPDVKVDLDTSKPVVFGDPASDNQLVKALDVLKSKATQY